MCLVTLFLCVCMYGILRCVHMDTILYWQFTWFQSSRATPLLNTCQEKFCWVHLCEYTTIALRHLMASAKLPAMLRNILTRFLNRKEPEKITVEHLFYKGKYETTRQLSLQSAHWWSNQNSNIFQSVCMVWHDGLWADDMAQWVRELPPRLMTWVLFLQHIWWRSQLHSYLLTTTCEIAHPLHSK